jgi:hypothetical protein
VGDAVRIVNVVDLFKLIPDRVKEPAYKGKPAYCLLVFGPEAKTRAWVVMDGDLIYIDRSGNGDLTEPGKQVVWKGSLKTMELGSIHSPDGKSRWTVSLRKFPASVRMMGSDEVKRPVIGLPARVTRKSRMGTAFCRRLFNMRLQSADVEQNRVAAFGEIIATPEQGSHAVS